MVCIIRVIRFICLLKILMKGGSGSFGLHSKLRSSLAANTVEKEKIEMASVLQQQATDRGARNLGRRKGGTAAKRIITNAALNDAQTAKAELEEEESDAQFTIDSDELSEVLEVMDLDDAVDVASDSPDDEDEESRSIQELLRYSEGIAKRAIVSEGKAMEEDMDEVTEEEEEERHRSRSHWLMTTCRYCGDIYRFRSDQVQPPTCGRPQCITKFEERSKKLLVAR